MSEMNTDVGVNVLPWGIEADHPRNSDLLLQSLPGCRLRSAIDGTKTIIDAKTGDVRVPLDQARSLASFPKTPGRQIHINLETLSYTVIDPLHNNLELCERISRFLRHSEAFASVEVIKGVPPEIGEIDVNKMKTLCREMLQLVNANEAKLVKGPLPTLLDISELPGEFLLNPGSRVMNTQPQFEKDFPEWIQNLSRMGG